MMHLCVFCMDDGLHPFVCYLVTQMQKFMFSIICIVLSGEHVENLELSLFTAFINHACQFYNRIYWFLKFCMYWWIYGAMTLIRSIPFLMEIQMIRLKNLLPLLEKGVHYYVFALLRLSTDTPLSCFCILVLLLL